jgi:hypothetical protein
MKSLILKRTHQKQNNLEKEKNLKTRKRPCELMQRRFVFPYYAIRQYLLIALSYFKSID